MALFKVCSGDIVAGVGSYEDCVSCIEWLEEEGADVSTLHIEKLEG